eukprot:gene2937-5770_t
MLPTPMNTPNNALVEKSLTILNEVEDIDNLWKQYRESSNRCSDLIAGAKATRVTLLDIEKLLADTELKLQQFLNVLRQQQSAKSSSLGTSIATLQMINQQSELHNKYHTDANRLRSTITHIEQMIECQVKISRDIFSHILASFSKEIPNNQSNAFDNLFAPNKIIQRSKQSSIDSSFTVNQTSQPLKPPLFDGSYSANLAIQQQLKSLEKLRQDINMPNMYHNSYINPNNNINNNDTATTTTTTKTALLPNKMLSQIEKDAIFQAYKTYSNQPEPSPPILDHKTYYSNLNNSSNSNSNLSHNNNYKNEYINESLKKRSRIEKDSNPNLNIQNYEKESEYFDLTYYNNNISNNNINSSSNNNNMNINKNSNSINSSSNNNNTSNYNNNVEGRNYHSNGNSNSNSHGHGTMITTENDSESVNTNANTNNSSIPEAPKDGCDDDNDTIDDIDDSQVDVQLDDENEGKLQSSTEGNPIGNLVFIPDPVELEKRRQQWYRPNMDSKEAMWNTYYDIIVLYGEIYGHCNLSQSTRCVLTNGEVIMLGGWVSRQRKMYGKMKLPYARTEKLQILVDQGMFSWSLKDRLTESIKALNSDRWLANYELLLKYAEENGNCNVPISYSATSPDGTVVRLGNWLKDQRSERRKNNLREDRLQKLQELFLQGKFSWDAGLLATTMKDEQWNHNYADLLKYGEDYGHYNVPHTFMFIREDGSKLALGNWLGKQRYLKASNTLRFDRLERLQALADEGKLSWRSANVSPAQSASQSSS